MAYKLPGICLLMLALVLGGLTFASAEEDSIEEAQDTEEVGPPMAEAVQAPTLPNVTISSITPVGRGVAPNTPIIITFENKIGPDIVDIQVFPEVPCQWFAIGGNHLQCIPQEPLKLATNYLVTVNRKIGGETLFSQGFSTEAVSLLKAEIINWLSATRPVVELEFSQPVAKTAIQSHFFLTSEGVALPFSYRSMPVSAVETHLEVSNHWSIVPETELLQDKTLILNQAQGLISVAGNVASDEEGRRLTWATYPRFDFLGIQCVTKGQKKVITSQDKWPICEVGKRIEVMFSTPINAAKFAQGFELVAMSSGEVIPFEITKIVEQHNVMHLKGKKYSVDISSHVTTAQHYMLRSKHETAWRYMTGRFFKTLHLGTIVQRVKQGGNILAEDRFGQVLEGPVTIAFSVNGEIQ